MNAGTILQYHTHNLLTHLLITPFHVLLLLLLLLPTLWGKEHFYIKRDVYLHYVFYIFLVLFQSIAIRKLVSACVFIFFFNECMLCTEGEGDIMYIYTKSKQHACIEYFCVI